MFNNFEVCFYIGSILDYALLCYTYEDYKNYLGIWIIVSFLGKGVSSLYVLIS